jgi:hypothetical protein
MTFSTASGPMQSKPERAVVLTSFVSGLPEARDMVCAKS